MPRSATNVLSTAFQATERTLVELYELTLPTSAQYFLANRDSDVPSHAQLGGQKWFAFPLERDRARAGADLRVDDMEVRFANASLSFGGSASTLAELAMRGIIDGARVRIYLADLTDVAGGRFFHSEWRVQGAQADRAQVAVTLESPVADLLTMTPRRTWAEQCQWPLFSTWCTLSRGGWSVYGTVASGTTTTHVQFTPTSYGVSVPVTVPGSWFELGQLSFTAGPVNGLHRTIRVQSASVASGAVGAFDLLTALPVTPNVGDAINMVPGCNKTLDHCVGKFNNVDNFGGMPYVPRPETPIGV